MWMSILKRNVSISDLKNGPNTKVKKLNNYITYPSLEAIFKKIFEPCETFEWTKIFSIQPRSFDLASFPFNGIQNFLPRAQVWTIYATSIGLGGNFLHQAKVVI
jgi:hypothetical protein